VKGTLDVCGQVRALRWADGVSGVLSGTLEGLYEGFRLGDDEGDRSAFELELANGSLAVELDVLQVGGVGLPARPGEHPFSGPEDPIGVLMAAGESADTEGRAPWAPQGQAGIIAALTVLPEASSGIFAGARGVVEVVVPNYREGGSMVVYTDAGRLWMDYLQRGDGSGLQLDLWVDNLRSTGLWRGADGKLRMALELHPPNVALGTYEGTVTCVPCGRHVASV